MAQMKYDNNELVTINELWKLGVMPIGIRKMRYLFAQGSIKSIKIGKGGKRWTRKKWIDQWLRSLK